MCPINIVWNVGVLYQMGLLTHAQRQHRSQTWYLLPSNTKISLLSGQVSKWHSFDQIQNHTMKEWCFMYKSGRHLKCIIGKKNHQEIIMPLTLLSRLQSLKTWQLQKPKGSETYCSETGKLHSLAHNICFSPGKTSSHFFKCLQILLLLTHRNPSLNSRIF